MHRAANRGKKFYLFTSKHAKKWDAVADLALRLYRNARPRCRPLILARKKIEKQLGLLYPANLIRFTKWYPFQIHPITSQ
ncbi:MAG: hypothetical protein IPI46_06830 [Bacteroidetes bacterium]|nr:hypothetical protein [Bacteroidota bacterium]